MDIVQAIVLGIIQGIFEWLPVSSEAVITLTQMYLFETSTQDALKSAIWLHTGTMLAALLYFRERFRELIITAYQQVQSRKLQDGTENGRTLAFIIIATFMTSVLGGTLYLVGIESVIDYPDIFAGLMGAALLFTGILRLYEKEATRNIQDIKWKDSVFVGALQGLAIIPGVSRSGSTVFGLLYRDFSAEDAFVLSFLLSVPAVFIANIGMELFTGFELSSEMIVATTTAFVVGYVSIDAVLKIADRAGIAYLCFLLAVISWLPLLI